MEEGHTTVVQRAFTSVTEAVFPASRGLREISRRRILNTGIHSNCTFYSYLYCLSCPRILNSILNFTVSRMRKRVDQTVICSVI